MQRLNRIVGHLGGAVPQLAHNNVAAASAKRDDDIVIVSAVRTAIGKAKKGSFKDTHPALLLSAALQGAVNKGKVKPELIGDIVVGTVLPVAGFAAQARMSMFLAGFPESVPITTVNRQCSSGLQAFANVAASIKAGFYDIGIAAGVESMSTGDMMNIGDVCEEAFENPSAQKCLQGMGQTSENLANEFKVSREVQDKMAVESHRRAAAAQASGAFDDEIVPVKTKDGLVTKDDGPRADTTLAGIAKLKPAFAADGTTTAGNSSQVSDGAAAVVLTTRAKAKQLGLPIIGSFKSYDAVGVRPEVMGIGPAVSIPRSLAKAGLKIEDIDAFEVNEAFASQATYCCDQLKLDMKKVNPNGGAIALGHPLGCTGARQIATLMNYLRRNKGRYGVVSMCIGTGMGASAVFEAEY